MGSPRCNDNFCDSGMVLKDAKGGCPAHVRRKRSRSPQLRRICDGVPNEFQMRLYIRDQLWLFSNHLFMMYLNLRPRWRFQYNETDCVTWLVYIIATSGLIVECCSQDNRGLCGGCRDKVHWLSKVPQLMSIDDGYCTQPCRICLLLSR